MSKTKLDETYVSKIGTKCESFDVAIGIKFVEFSFTNEPGRYLL